jgi:hypothetical protein
MTDAKSLTIALGGKWSGPSGSACCPAHDDHTPSLSITDGSDGRLLLHCFAGCSFRDIHAALDRRGHMTGANDPLPPDPVRQAARKAETAAQAEKRSKLACQLWDKAVPIIGTPAERYLRGRCITCVLPYTLRYIGNCWHQSAISAPALVSNITGSSSFAIHRTYLRDDGLGKANLDPVKVMLGPVAGGTVRLSSGPGPLVVAEGIETGLSLLSGILTEPARVWAALSTGGMEKLILPPKAGALIIAHDGDEPGKRAAAVLTTRARLKGWHVSFLAPPDGLDWNDVLMEKGTTA